MDSGKLRLFYFAPLESVHTVRWLSAFVKLGHEVHLATTNVAPAHGIRGVAMHDIHLRDPLPSPLRFFQRWLKVRRILREVRPHIVHGHCISWSGGYAALVNVHPLVLTAWGTDILVGPRDSWLQRILIPWRLRRADLVTVDSEDLGRAAMAFGVRQDRLALIQWGVDVERIRSLRGNGRLRRVANVSPGAVAVLSVRYFEPNFNLESVMRAIPKVLSGTRQEVCFVFVGGGSLQSALEGLAKQLGVDRYVRFIGKLPHEELEECYGDADLYVSVPQSDSTSVSLLEAMAAGLPVIVSDVPSNLEWIQDGWNGYVVRRGDSAAIAESVLRLLENGDLRRQLGVRNAQLATERADHLTNMRKMERLYQELVVARTRRP
jgi:glycosyltransferase involved in cell wall biosynthesis